MSSRHIELRFKMPFEIHLEGCYENGALEAMLKESGFREVASEPPLKIGMPIIDIPIHLAAYEVINR